jgi:hypothetical protein
MDPDFWRSLSQQDARVLLASLWAAKDVHAPIDNLSDEDWLRLDELANALNTEYKYDIRA